MNLMLWITFRLNRLTPTDSYAKSRPRLVYGSLRFIGRNIEGFLQEKVGLYEYLSPDLFYADIF